MLRAGGVGARLSLAGVPRFAGARELAREGVVPGGTRKNLAGVEGMTEWGAGVEEADRLLLADAQTSGGLLIAVPSAARDRLIGRLRELGTPAAALVGEITASRGLHVGA
jgi:selenide,water dikinase